MPWRSRAWPATRPSPRALWLRALLLERERIANHLGDLGYLGNDGGLAFGLAQFSRLKEDLLRLNAKLFGHRYLMDRIVPGGVAIDVDAHAAEEILAECTRLRAELRTLRAIYYDHAGLQDRCITCGRLRSGHRRRAGRGRPRRARQRPRHGLARLHPGSRPTTSWTCASPRTATAMSPRASWCVSRKRSNRSNCSGASCAACRRAPCSRRSARRRPAAGASAGSKAGAARCWSRSQAGAGGRVRRCHPHDPSWQNWPALEHAVIGNIVPDFPLINKSFNLSYAGADL